MRLDIQPEELYADNNARIWCEGTFLMLHEENISRQYIDAYLYLSWGAQEGDGMHEFVMETKGCTDLANLLLKKGVRIHFHVKPLGRHCEEDWEKESDQFLSFLMHES